MEIEPPKPPGTRRLPDRLLKSIVYRVIVTYPEPVETGTILECANEALVRLGYHPTRGDQVRQQLIWLRGDGLVRSERVPGSKEHRWSPLAVPAETADRLIFEAGSSPLRHPPRGPLIEWARHPMPGPETPQVLPTDDEQAGAEETLTMFGAAPLWHPEPLWDPAS